MQQTQRAMLEAGHPTASAASNAPASPASLTDLNEHLMQEDGAVAPAVPAAASSGGLMLQQGSDGSAGPLNGWQDAMAVQSDDSSSDDMQVDSAQRHSALVLGHSLASSGDQQMALCADMSRCEACPCWGRGGSLLLGCKQPGNPARIRSERSVPAGLGVREAQCMQPPPGAPCSHQPELKRTVGCEVWGVSIIMIRLD